LFVTDRNFPDKKPTKLLYPTDYWPVPDGASQNVFDNFIVRLERFLDIERTTVNLGELWLRTIPEGVNTPVEEYFSHVFDWAANPDQWTGFFKDFVERYEAEHGRPPALNPQWRYKRYLIRSVAHSS
jgi:hypothetical protein